MSFSDVPTNTQEKKLQLLEAINSEKIDVAERLLQDLVVADPLDDLLLTLMYLQVLNDETETGMQYSRDIGLGIMSNYSQVLLSDHEDAMAIVRHIAILCHKTNKTDKAIELYGYLTQSSYANDQDAMVLYDLKQLRLEKEKASIFEVVKQGDPDKSIPLLQSFLNKNPKDYQVMLWFIKVFNNNVHSRVAQLVDLLSKVKENDPNILLGANKYAIEVVRHLARLTNNTGQREKAIKLYEELIQVTSSADDYFTLSEILSFSQDRTKDVVYNLKMSMAVDAEKYDTEDNRYALNLLQKNLRKKKKIGRYPDNKAFKDGSLSDLIEQSIAADLHGVDRFLTKDSRVFTMGSCFARNVAISLCKAGYFCKYFDIAEHINTTFANKLFVQWLEGDNSNTQVINRFVELLPNNWDRDKLLKELSEIDVYIITLGVAPAFFDAITGEFILPKRTALNSRALAEQYVYKNTSVEENVNNVLTLINFVRKLSPKVKIIVTVSPVPMTASFEHESCVVADCLSKSTMRIVADEVVNKKGLGDIYYWPSFEIFRWAGSNSSDFFGVDDGNSIHVSEDKVSLTIDSFIKTFSV